MMISMRRTPSTRRPAASPPTTPPAGSSAASAAIAAAWAARPACTRPPRPSPTPPSPSTCKAMPCCQDPCLAPAQDRCLVAPAASAPSLAPKGPDPGGRRAGLTAAGLTCPCPISPQEPGSPLRREPALRERPADRQGLSSPDGTVGLRGQVLLVMGPSWEASALLEARAGAGGSGAAPVPALPVLGHGWDAAPLGLPAHLQLGLGHTGSRHERGGGSGQSRSLSPSSQLQQVTPRHWWLHSTGSRRAIIEKA